MKRHGFAVAAAILLVFQACAAAPAQSGVKEENGHQTQQTNEIPTVLKILRGDIDGFVYKLPHQSGTKPRVEGIEKLEQFLLAEGLASKPAVARGISYTDTKRKKDDDIRQEIILQVFRDTASLKIFSKPYQDRDPRWASGVVALIEASFRSRNLNPGRIEIEIFLTKEGGKELKKNIMLGIRGIPSGTL